MGKYMRKPKTTRDIDVSHSPLGVRTRARTLALQRLKSSATVAADYLELRSRRLQKPPLLKKYLQNSPKIPKQGFVCTDTENPQIGGTNQGSPIEPAKEVGGCAEWLNGGSQIGDLEIEASFGENNLDTEPRERGTRESTPCSMIRAADSITAPGSSTKRISPDVSNRRAQNAHRNIPTAREMEEFFSHAEQPQERLFMEKYNFDIVNDVPLPGRYEWVRVMP
ncbi:cyclin-dependent kinase inhibitor 3-like [Salvia miltiorrhiza]|uniref:cyclin-dependent kinase inhibitor 3-like n=1 Tax=Salvia miltiorrhiza TaxID=226208 RepID=UPI0025AC8406|nr:cyclin-dependent kinase inhibitor 3-like [Salvia miltiorrhiza]